MTYLLTLLHVLGCLVLIGVVLLQTGKRADLAGAFGGGGSQTAFGTRGAATFLSKMTTACAVLFMLTSLGLSLVTSGGGAGRTVLDDVDAPATESTPPPPAEDSALPGAAAPAEEPAADGSDAAEPDPVEDATAPPTESEP